jgi:putative Holliday junction resolvase
VTVRRGVRLGVDVGTVRVGVARSDPDGILATPVETLPRADDDSDKRAIIALADEVGAIEIVVGLPKSLDGKQRASARAATEYARGLAGLASRSGLSSELRLVDERLTSTAAHRSMHASGRSGRRQREVVDQVAAVLILQTALDSERTTGRPAGRPIAVRTPKETQE